MFKKPWYYREANECSVSGDPEVVTYDAYYDIDGVLQLKESGKKNLYDEIQSHKLSTDINVILQRYAAGDVDVLNRIQGVYADVTKAPHTFAEMMNITIQAKADFDALPVEIKNKFGNNFVQFMETYGTTEWFDRVGISNNTDEVKEVTDNES